MKKVYDAARLNTLDRDAREVRLTKPRAKKYSVRRVGYSNTGRVIEKYARPFESGYEPVEEGW